MHDYNLQLPIDSPGPNCDSCPRHQECIYLGEHFEDACVAIGLEPNIISSKPVIGAFAAMLVSASPRLTCATCKTKMKSNHPEYDVVIWDALAIVNSLVAHILDSKRRLQPVDWEIHRCALASTLVQSYGAYDQGALKVTIAKNMADECNPAGHGCAVVALSPGVVTGPETRQ